MSVKCGNIFIFFLVSSANVFGGGFNDNYQIKYGDYEGDGLLNDLYVEYVPDIVLIHGEVVTPIVINAEPPVENFILQSDSNGSFQIRSNLSTSERKTFSLWGESDVVWHLGDYNADGFLDLDLDEMNVSGEAFYDQIIYAPNNAGSSPTSLTSVTPDVTQFFVELDSWINDRDYFENKAIENGWYDYEGDQDTGWFNIAYIDIYYLTPIGNRFLYEDDNPLDENNLPSYCENFISNCDFFEGRWWVWGTYLKNIEIVYNYENFNQEALSIKDTIENVEVEVPGETIVVEIPSQEGQEVLETVEDVIGEDVYVNEDGEVVIETQGQLPRPEWEERKKRGRRLKGGFWQWFWRSINEGSATPKPVCKNYLRGDDPGKTEFFAHQVENLVAEGLSLRDAKKAAHNRINVQGWDDLAIEHAMDSSDSPLISVTEYLKVAQRWGSEVYVITFGEGQYVNKNIYNTFENEWLARVHIPSWYVNNPRPAWCKYWE